MAVLSLLLCLPQTASAEDPVHFNDATLKAAVEMALGKANPTPADMLNLATLDASSRDIADLTGLEYATGLTWLALMENEISDISPIAGLTHLDFLNLAGNQIDDVSGLAGLTDLTTLYLEGNYISDISPLAAIVDLSQLHLDGNPISDLSPLASLTYLRTLRLTNSLISDISPLAGLTHLTDLYLTGNQISDISGLAGLTNLTRLYLRTNQIGDISPLAGLTHLTNLDMEENQISDISVLAGLTDLANLPLGWNQISDISPLAGLMRLMYLHLESNPLNADACTIYIPQIRSNNPGILIKYDPCLVDRCVLVMSMTAGGLMTDPPEGTLDYDRGAVVPVIAVAQNGWHFVGWTGTAMDAGKVANPGLAGTTVTMDGDYTLQANFEANAQATKHTLTIAYGRGGAVATEVGPGQTLTGPGSFVLDDGAAVEVTAKAESGWGFTGWTGTMTSGKSTLAFTLTADQYLEAHFARDVQTLVVSSGAGGSVVKPGVGSFAFERGATIPVEAAANPGFRFAGWTGTMADRRDIADPRLSQTSFVLNESGTLRANFEWISGFHESWETAMPGIFAPGKGKLINADQGAWSLGDAISGSLACGPTPQRAQILKLGSAKALLLASTDSESDCSDSVSVSLTETGPVNPGFGLPVDGNTVLSFYEVGRLDQPGVHGLGRDCVAPPCFDNVSLLLGDNKGNVLAYVLQRSPDAVANVPNANVKGSYREIFLNPTDIYYERNLLSDLQTIPGFDPAGAQVRSIEFRVDEHGSAIIDDITIGPGTVGGTTPVYRFWSRAIQSQLFTTSADEKQNLIDLPSGAWTFEGIAYFAVGKDGNPNAAPVYHFYSSALSSHLYTVSEAEKDRLVKDSQHLWTLREVAFYAFPEGRQPTGTCPVYRFWSDVLSCYLYTTSEAERDDLLSSPDTWTSEGVAWHAYPSPWDSAQALETLRARP